MPHYSRYQLVDVMAETILQECLPSGPFFQCLVVLVMVHLMSQPNEQCLFWAYPLNSIQCLHGKVLAKKGEKEI